MSGQSDGSPGPLAGAVSGWNGGVRDSRLGAATREAPRRKLRTPHLEDNGLHTPSSGGITAVWMAFK